MKKEQYIKIADSIDEIPFGNNNLAEIIADGKKICIARYQGKLLACAHKCPHASGLMANGYLDPTGNIVCPLHRYKFNLENGRNVSGEGYYLKTFKIIVNESGVFFEKPIKKGFF